MSMKVSFVYYMKTTRVMLPVAFEEFELVYTFLVIFSCHYHCQLVKGQNYQKYRGATAFPSLPGFYGPED